jgi:peptidyl-dipeptidase Dcp
MKQNPLLIPSPHPFGAPDFAAVAVDDFVPAIRAAIDEARGHIATLKNNPEAPNFTNTIVALETASDRLRSATSLFYNQISANGTDALEALTDQIGPLTAGFASDVALDPAIFARVRAVYDARTSLALTPEEQTLLTETYKGFVRGGAMLGDNAKARVRAIDERLSVLAPQFQKNLKKSAEAYTLWVEDQTRLAGLPDSAMTAAAEAARDKGRPGAWAFTLQQPSYVALVSYADDRDLREQIWRAYNARAFGDAFDNRATIREMLALKYERARLLGYDDHAAFTLAERMAGSTERVFSFIHEMLAAYKPAAEKDLAALRDFARRMHGLDDFMPWDTAYYREKFQAETLDFSSEELRPYFPLDRVLAGTFTHFEKLFGVHFVANKTVPTWHPDVQVFEVRNRDDNQFVGVLYADFYPRAGKQSGAWMTTYRDQGLQFGQTQRPLVAIVCNFTKPTADAPSLLTHDEVLTLFHEMGHAMHMMLSDVTYASLSGTNVKWDFVELPSQIQENWAYEPETLGLVAAHYQTGAPIPDDLIKRLYATKQFMTGLAGLRQMAFSLLDMTWYSTDPATMGDDVVAFEDRVMKDVTLFPRLAGPVSTSFGHIFGGGYAAGYYSYKWAEVLDADAFDFFKAQGAANGTGLYDPSIASRYRREILSRGGTEDPNVLYERFRGMPPDAKALFKREGVSKKIN